ncbi:MAG: hypothetical protein ACLPTJ_22400 [Solirubrobacteraceae bacterium]
MEAAWLARMRWRRRGAWLWPTFAAATVLDGALLHALPAAGATQTLVGGIVAGMVFNVLAVLLLSRPLGVLVRRARPDMPVVVARNYAGTFAVLFVSAVMLAIGLAHHSTVVAQQRALDDAVMRAEAYIGDRAPAQFRVNVTHTNTYTIQAGAVYRTCVPNRAGTRSYCVIVKTKLPLAQSVVPAGYEPNSVLSEGTN